MICAIWECCVDFGRFNNENVAASGHASTSTQYYISWPPHLTGCLPLKVEPGLFQLCRDLPIKSTIPGGRDVKVVSY